MPLHRICAQLVFLSICIGTVTCLAQHAPESSQQFFSENCFDCHQGVSAEAGLDLEALLKGRPVSDSAESASPPAETPSEQVVEGNPAEPAARSEEDLETWIKIFDRVTAGEMPPPDYGEVDDQEQLAGWLAKLEENLYQYQSNLHRQRGRTQARRLTNVELERTLQDLLGIDIPLERELPEEPKTGHFSTLAVRQSISHFQLEHHLRVVDLALDEAFRRALTPADEWVREMSAKDISRTRRRTREPEFIDDGAVVWSSNLAFYGRLPATTARHDGWFRFKFEVESLKEPQEHAGVWCTIRSGKCVSSAPLMAWVNSFEATSQPRTVVVTAWLPKGHMLEIRPGDKTLKMARFAGGQSANGEGGKQDVPGIRINGMTIERLHLGGGDEQIRSILFGDLAVEVNRSEEKSKIAVEQPVRQGHQLLDRFVDRAFRRPTSTDLKQRYHAIFDAALASGAPFREAIRSSYRAVLCSSRFLYFFEQPGELDAYSIANRLSYLIWKSMPDEPLLAAAESGELMQPQAMRNQVTRMLQSTRGKQFVSDFASEWLQLEDIDFTEPDRRLHPNFDIIVQYAMLDETHALLEHLLAEDLSVKNLVQCDFTFLTSRLARFYEIPIAGPTSADPLPQDANQVRLVSLGDNPRRGGLLSHGSILKVSANGTNTSPVLRGVWVSERILGIPIPPPPDSVPAIEPDIRGAKSIREQLEKHRNNPDCASCHAKIDGPGFALENFDAAGRWREYYPRLEGKRVKRGQEIDVSYETPDGREFNTFNDFRNLIGQDVEPIARNLLEKLLAYGTGSETTFADRRELDRIATDLQESDYGFRSILDAAVTSSIFRSK